MAETETDGRKERVAPPDRFRGGEALPLVDLPKDFCPGGKLPVTGPDALCFAPDLDVPKEPGEFHIDRNTAFP